MRVYLKFINYVLWVDKNKVWYRIVVIYLNVDDYGFFI